MSLTVDSGTGLEKSTPMHSAPKVGARGLKTMPESDAVDSLTVILYYSRIQHNVGEANWGAKHLGPAGEEVEGIDLVKCSTDPTHMRHARGGDPHSTWHCIISSVVEDEEPPLSRLL
jgi:hypothetical protein